MFRLANSTLSRCLQLAGETQHFTYVDNSHLSERAEILDAFGDADARVLRGWPGNAGAEIETLIDPNRTGFQLERDFVCALLVARAHRRAEINSPVERRHRVIQPNTSQNHEEEFSEAMKKADASRQLMSIAGWRKKRDVRYCVLPK